MKKLIILLAVLLICVPRVEAMNTDEIIDGVTGFMISRAKENQFYIFENQLRKNNDLQKYFPQTYSYIADGDLKVLITSKRLLEKAVKKDLDTLVTRTFAKSITDHIDLSKEADKAMAKYVAVAQLVSVEIDGKSYPINVVPWPASEEPLAIINGFWNEANNLRDSFIELNNSLVMFSDPTNIDEVSSQVLLKKARAIEDAFKDLDKLLAHISKYKKQLRINKDQLEQLCASDPSLYFCLKTDPAAAADLHAIMQGLEGPLQAVLSKAIRLGTYLQDVAGVDTYTERVILSIRFLDDIGLGDKIDIAKFKRHILFFARLADIDSADEVEAILVEYTMPPVSFFVKREERTTHVLVSAYLGYAGGDTFSTEGAGSENDHGIIAPIGLEFSRGIGKGGSVSLLLAPVDFGYPVTLKLNGLEEKLSFSDIFAPGVYLSYGIPDYPLTTGFAYQRGRQIEATGDVENRVLFFIAFDMPLWTLY